MESLIFTSLLIIGSGYLIRHITKGRVNGIRLNENTGFKFLLAWIIFGFVTRLDYSENLGCIIGIEPIFDPRNILFSAISFVLILWAIKTKNHHLKKSLVSIELLFWIGKLIGFKGGYVIGFAGTPNIFIVFYDLVAILIRLFILSQILKLKNPGFIKIGITAFVVIAIKILFFATPLSTIYEWSKAHEEAREIRKELIGDWNGEVMKSNYETLETRSPINIRIDSSHIYLDSIPGLDVQYKFSLDYPEMGFLAGEEEIFGYDLFIQHQNQDSLVITLFYEPETYEFRLKKK